METRIHEIADGIYRLSTFVTHVAPPAGFTFNQFLVMGDEPLLFHCGHRAMFPSISSAVAKLLPLERLRWVTFSHVEADECGALNLWLGAAPSAAVAHGATGCAIWLNDAADRPPAKLADGQVIDIGGKRLRRLDTPHLPHGWDAGLLYEETTGTLLCSDLFAHTGDPPPLTTADILAPAIDAESHSQSMSVTAKTAPMLRRLAALRPRTLGLMHGSSFNGDATGLLNKLADHIAAQLTAAA
jgi:flavorubredoxin